MAWKSERNPMFNSPWSESIFYAKYALGERDTWVELAGRLVNEVCEGLMKEDERYQLYEFIRDMKFIPGGRYLYYAGRGHKFYNNCFLFRSEEDSREDWARISWQAEMALMTGGGIGNDYSRYRGEGSKIKKTGGVASGPVAKMQMINEIGRHVMQGGSRRSAIYASLDRDHPDIMKFIHAKDWHKIMVPGTNMSIADIKKAGTSDAMNFPAPLDMTNISVNYKTDWLGKEGPNGEFIGEAKDEVFLDNVRQAMMTGEPGFSFNFFGKENETLRNACTEITSEDDSDVCNLGSINMARVSSLYEFRQIVELSTKFLLCGTLRAELPYPKVNKVRKKNRRLGLGLMGMHEWLINRNSKYEVTPELHAWLWAYKNVSDETAKKFSKQLSVSTPVACRAIAPTGSIGILAGTTTGIEPMFAPAVKRRYLRNGTKWHYQYVVEPVAARLADAGGDPDTIEGAADMAANPERRIRFQADVQDYVDQSISSTINLPAWGTEGNNEDHVGHFADLLARYAPRLRGLTFYPNGSRGGQPLTPVPFAEVRGLTGREYREDVVAMDVCDITGNGGTCGS
mgnify:CR=1 FL=1